MMSGVEIFGVAGTAVQCADVAFRLCSALAQFESDRRHSGSRVEALQRQVKSLWRVIESIQISLQARASAVEATTREENRILPLIRESLEECQETLIRFEKEVEDIHGPQYETLKSNLLKSARTTLRLRRKGGIVNMFEREVEGYLTIVQIHLSCLHESSIVELTNAIRNGRAALPFFMQGQLSHPLPTPSRNQDGVLSQQESTAQPQRVQRRQSQAVDNDDSSDGEGTPEDTVVESHTFSHLRESIKVAQKIRTSRPGSIRSDQPRRPSVNCINDIDKTGKTMLVRHIITGEPSMVAWALDNGADAEVKCEDKAPLLHAVEKRNVDMVNLLWDYQPTLDLETRDSEGRTALAVAAMQGDVEMICALLDLNAQIESTTPNNETPLMFAAESGSVAAVETLIRNKANCAAVDKQGWSTLHHAVHGPDRAEVQLIVQYFINSGVDVDCCALGDETPLHKAVQLNKTFALKTLLENNGNWAVQHSGSRNCLQIAVEEEHTDTVKLLVETWGAVWDGKIPKQTPNKIKTLLEKSRAHMPLPSRTYSVDSGISMNSSLRSTSTRSRRFVIF